MPCLLKGLHSSSSELAWSYWIVNEVGYVCISDCDVDTAEAQGASGDMPSDLPQRHALNEDAPAALEEAGKKRKRTASPDGLHYRGRQACRFSMKKLPLLESYIGYY